MPDSGDFGHLLRGRTFFDYMQNVDRYVRMFEAEPIDLRMRCPTYGAGCAVFEQDQKVGLEQAVDVRLRTDVGHLSRPACLFLPA
jgi:hypothetical protein